MKTNIEAKFKLIEILNISPVELSYIKDLYLKILFLNFLMVNQMH